MKILGLILLLMTGVTLIVGVFYGIYQWFRAAGLMLSIPQHYRPGVAPVGWRTAFNPFTGILVPTLLTPEGQKLVASFWKAIITFVLCVLIPFAVAYLTELVTGEQLIRR